MNCASARWTRATAPRRHHEAAARQFRGGFEIHAGFDAGNVEMLHRGEVEAARRAPAADFDVVGLVRALGHFVQRQVRDARAGGRAAVHPRWRPRRSGARFRPSSRPPARAGARTRPRRRAPWRPRPPCEARVLVGLRGFGGLNPRCAAPRRPRAAAIGRHARQAAPREGGIEGGGIFADGADVVHGVLWAWPGFGAPYARARDGFQILSALRDPVTAVARAGLGARTSGKGSTWFGLRMFLGRANCTTGQASLHPLGATRRGPGDRAGRGGAALPSPHPADRVRHHNSGVRTTDPRRKDDRCS